MGPNAALASVAVAGGKQDAAPSKCEAVSMVPMFGSGVGRRGGESLKRIAAVGKVQTSVDSRARQETRRGEVVEYEGRAGLAWSIGCAVEFVDPARNNWHCPRSESLGKGERGQE